MVDDVLAARAQSASVSGRTERASSRAALSSVRGLNSISRLPEGSQRAFGASFSKSSINFPEERKPAERGGSGLLATDVQILLAETRSQEASGPSSPPSRVGQAINVYLETQSQVRDTIRATANGFAGAPGLAAGTQAGPENGQITSNQAGEDDPYVGESLVSPIDSSID